MSCLVIRNLFFTVYVRKLISSHHSICHEKQLTFGLHHPWFFSFYPNCVAVLWILGNLNGNSCLSLDLCDWNMENNTVMLFKIWIITLQNMDNTPRLDWNPSSYFHEYRETHCSDPEVFNIRSTSQADHQM